MLNISVIKPTFLIGNWKKIKFFKTSFNNSISFSHIKLLLTLIFAPDCLGLLVSSMVVWLIDTATSLSLVWPYSMFFFPDQWLSSPPSFRLRVMYQTVCLTNDVVGKKMAFGNYKISINLFFHKKTNLCSLFALFFVTKRSNS